MERISFFNQSALPFSHLNYSKYLRLILVVVFVWVLLWWKINPGKIFADSRDVVRMNQLKQVMDAITIYQVSTGNDLVKALSIPGCDQPQVIGTGKTTIDLQKQLTAEYLDVMPFDPLHGTTANTGYTICQTEFKRLKLTAIYAESKIQISLIR
ncbi:MAG: hypothetical protein WCJ58_01495 [bacterium]